MTENHPKMVEAMITQMLEGKPPNLQKFKPTLADFVFLLEMSKPGEIIEIAGHVLEYKGRKAKEESQDGKEIHGPSDHGSTGKHRRMDK